MRCQTARGKGGKPIMPSQCALRRAGLCLLLLCLVSGRAAGEVPVLRLIADTSQLDQAYIRDGRLVTNYTEPNRAGTVARYTGVELGEVVARASCTATFAGGGAVAIVCGPLEWSVAGITARSIHAVFTAEGYHFGFYENGVLEDVLAGSYALDTSGETEYSFGFSIRDRTITLRLPDGKTARKYDERVIRCGGTRVVFEHYLTAGDVLAGASPAIVSVDAAGASLPPLHDDFNRRDGLPHIAPSGHMYYQFRND